MKHLLEKINLKNKRSLRHAGFIPYLRPLFRPALLSKICPCLARAPMILRMLVQSSIPDTMDSYCSLHLTRPHLNDDVPQTEDQETSAYPGAPELEWTIEEGGIRRTLL